MENIDVFLNGLDEFGLKIDDSQVEKMKEFKGLLKEWNEKINITTITEDSEVDIKHFLDSVSILINGKVDLKGKEIIDIGTGGGFPGIPLKIMEPSTEITLMDSLNKRIIFLNEVIDRLELEGIETIHGRAEEYGRKINYRETYDIAVSRAVASLDTLCEYCIPFVKVGGYFIAMKGKEVDEELANSERAIKKLGCILEERIDIKLPSSDIVHNLLLIKKIKKTVDKYPRGGGNPKKNPL